VRRDKKGQVSHRSPVSACRNRPEGFRASRREKKCSVFSDDMRVRKNTLREANVRFDRAPRAKHATSGAKLSQKSG
jgi:hypothetical protein